MYRRFDSTRTIPIGRKPWTDQLQASIVGAMKWHARPPSTELRGDGSSQLWATGGVNVVGHFDGKSSEMFAHYERAANEMRMAGFGEGRIQSHHNYRKMYEGFLLYFCRLM